MKIFLSFITILLFFTHAPFAYSRTHDEIDSPTERYASALKMDQEKIRELERFSASMNVPFPLVYQLLYVESEFKHKAVGPKTRYGQALGISQFMPETAEWIASMYGMSYAQKMLFDPYYSIKLSICYLHYLQHGGKDAHAGYHNWHKTLTAYNRGMYGLRQYEKTYGKSESAYSVAIMTEYEKNKSQY